MQTIRDAGILIVAILALMTVRVTDVSTPVVADPLPTVRAGLFAPPSGSQAGTSLSTFDTATLSPVPCPADTHAQPELREARLIGDAAVEVVVPAAPTEGRWIIVLDSELEVDADRVETMDAARNCT